VKNHDLTVFENLNIKGMAKRISDAGWNKIVQYTTYRVESAGKTVIPMDSNTHHGHVRNAEI
jgi:putative transposase